MFRMYRLLGIASALLLLGAIARPFDIATAAASPRLSLSPTSATAGTKVAVSGSAFPARRPGVVRVSGQQVATFTTDRRGRFSTTWIVPSTLPAGKVTVAATVDSKTASATLTITAAQAVAPAPTPTPSPTPTPTPSAPANACTTTLQTLVNNAAPGSTVLVPPCVYRESVLINKSLTLDGQGQAEIRGSDIWTNWQRSGSYWIGGSAPAFWTGGECADASNRCRWPEQVFFDGQPLVQVAANPAPGQFAIDSSRRVVLANDPTGHVVEVTTRTEWVRAGAAGVTIRGFIMKHAANPAQDGGISNDGYANWTIENNVLSDAHGAVVSIANATGLKVLNNDISRGGGLGIHGSKAHGAIVRGNRVYNNNTEAFSSGWEAGGIKISETNDLLIDGNHVYNNGGPGIWNDVSCARVTISNNRVHHNAKQGIAYELSQYGIITGNVVYENGLGYTVWGWGAGILVQNSAYTEVANNTLAWNGDGIAVISQNRWSDVWNTVIQNSVHDNVIVSRGNGATALGWFEDWAGVMARPESNNRGYANRYWYPEPDGQSNRFEWVNSLYSRLTDWNQTPAEEAATYLSTSERDQVLAAAGIPTTPD